MSLPLNITWKGSPNKDGVSFRKPIDRIVIHWFGTGTLASADTRFQNPASQVSAHYGISDETIYQWVADGDVAWHCGVYTMNQRSIGIEHDATTTKDASEKTYQTSGALVRVLCQTYSIQMDREHIIGHSEVKATQCPGSLDIDKIIAIAKEDNPCEKDLAKVREELIAMRESRNKWRLDHEELSEKYAREMAEKQKHIDSIQLTLSDTNLNLMNVTRNYNEMSQRVRDMEHDIEEMKKIGNIDLQTIGDLMDQVSTLEGQVKTLEEKSKKKLTNYTNKELILELYARIWR